MTELRRLSFVIPLALPSLNIMLRQHWAERAKHQKALHMEILAAFGPRYWPRPPFEKARVTVTRYSAKELDIDNLTASVKPLVDLFKPRSDRNPMGMGWIVDDEPGRCELWTLQDMSAPPRTSVVIEEMEYVPPPANPARKRFPRNRFRVRKRQTARAKAEFARSQRP